MAPNDKPRVIDADTDVHTDYKTDAARYAKLSELSRQKAAELKTQDDAAQNRYVDALTKASQAESAVAEADNAVKLQANYVQSLEREKAEIGDEAEKAQQAGDADKARELNDRYAAK